MRYFLALGFDVYLIDWGEVTEEHYELSLETYVLKWMPATLAAVRRESGEESLSCFCYCRGGLLTLMDLPTRYMHVPGWLNSLVFKLTSPMGSLINYWELLVNLWDREFVINHTTVSRWFNDMVDYPGQTPLLARTTSWSARVLPTACWTS